MHDDQLMDTLLKDAMRVETPPQLTREFDARLMRRLQPRRLTPRGRVVMAAYTAAATLTLVWAMHDMPLTTMLASVVISGAVAAGAGAYGKRLAFGG